MPIHTQQATYPSLPGLGVPQSNIEPPFNIQGATLTQGPNTATTQIGNREHQEPQSLKSENTPEPHWTPYAEEEDAYTPPSNISSEHQAASTVKREYFAEPGRQEMPDPEERAYTRNSTSPRAIRDVHDEWKECQDNGGEYIPYTQRQPSLGGIASKPVNG